jgi:GNAT superfamily N-acetyltransferase
MQADDIVLRTPRPGDMSRMQSRNMAVLAPLHGWDHRYEAELAELSAYFLRRLDSATDRFWIAVRGDEAVGCIGLMRESEAVGRLRLLYVEPAARGLGLGRRLVATCLDFARESGCREVVLWTVDVLETARRIYAEAGFVLEHAEMTDELGEPCMDERWRLVL